MTAQPQPARPDPQPWSVQRWNEQHGIPGVLAFVQQGELVCAQVTLEHTSATVFVQGAQLTRLAATQLGGEVLFLAQAAAHPAKGKSLRGGVPVSFPWFAADTQNRAGGKPGPSHGFARTQDWTLASATVTSQPDPDSEHTTLALVWTLGPSDASRSFGYDGFLLTYTMAFHSDMPKNEATVCELGLQVTNTSAAPLTYENALHTYFLTENVTQTGLYGLSGAPYLDKNDNNALKTLPNGSLVLSGPTDDVFPGHTGGVEIGQPDADGMRCLLAGKTGSASTIVWNPWEQGAAKIPGLQPGEWVTFVCVEAGNVGVDAITLAPGASHTLAMQFLPSGASSERYP